MKHQILARKDDCVLQNSMVLIQSIVIECGFKKSYQISSSWISSSTSICENISFTAFAHHLVSRSSLIIDRFCLHWSCSPSTGHTAGRATPMHAKWIKLVWSQNLTGWGIQLYFTGSYLRYAKLDD